MTITYDLWALGYDKFNHATDFEEFLGSFDTLDAAIEHSTKFADITYVYDADIIRDFMDKDDYMVLRVEQVEHPDEECEFLTDVLFESEIRIPKDFNWKQSC